MKITSGIGLLLVVGLVAAAVQPASADLLPIEEATEVMMESQGLQGLYLGFRLGSDDASTLRFTSRVDEVSFSYELEAGSTYLGLSATWTTTGSREEATGLWHWDTVCLIGAEVLSNSGTGGPFVGVDPPYFIPLDLPPLPIPDILVSDVTYIKKDGKTTSAGTITLKESGTGKVISAGKHTDKLHTAGPNKGRWEWDTGLFTDQKSGVKQFKVSALGFSPQPDGGLGSFRLDVRAVPEPSSIALVAGGGLIALGMFRRRRANPG